MLMITVEADGDTVRLRLGGRLAGPEARELARTWSAAKYKQPHQRIVFDVADVTSIDTVGVEFLAQVYRTGHTLVADPKTRAMLHEIEGNRIRSLSWIPQTSC
jgi:anti-anti-sigma regulatory factor